MLAHHTGVGVPILNVLASSDGLCVKPIGQAHFQGRVDFLDLFLRTDISSASRAQAFLWLCYNYLESPSSSDDDYDEDSGSTSNPFSDPAKQPSPPSFSFLTEEEMAQENQESAEDIAMTDKLVSQRSRIIQTQSVKDSAKGSTKASVSGSVAGDDDDTPASVVGDEPKAKGKQRAAPGAASAKVKGKRGAAAALKEKKVVPPKEKERPQKREPIALVPDLDDDDTMIDAFVKREPHDLFSFLWTLNSF